MTEKISCPVCANNSILPKLFLESNIDPSKLSDHSFASRKTPEFMCHRLVQCPSCDLVYADQPPSQDELAHAYHQANYNSSEEASDAANSYIQAIEPILKNLPQCQSALEIGTGTGIFLEKLFHHGFTNLVGVEPSPAAIAAAPSHRKKWIQEGIFDEKNFGPESFDLICCFMTMEHVSDPNVIASAALKLLRPGGAFVTVTHNYRGLVNKLLGKRSPIIDIEHMQLFSRKSLQVLFRNAEYIDFDAHGFVNTYSLQYWMRLAPVPARIKNACLNVMAKAGVDQKKIGINVGNFIATGYKRK